ncbi:MAG: glycosyltransferase family 39 protein, partial [Gemmatimonadales bacterium]
MLFAKVLVTRTKPMLPWAAWLLAAVVFVRLASLAFYPLTDATEARYANIARVMLE